MSSGSGMSNMGGTTGGTSAGMPDVGQMKQQAGQMANQFMDQAKGQINSQLDTQKSRAAQSLTSVAQALRTTSQQLRGGEQEPIAHVTEQAAGVMDNVSTYLRDARVEDMVADVEGFARRQPALFFGGAFALGFLAARFLKSSGNSHNGGSNRGYAGHGAYGTYGTDTESTYGYQSGGASAYGEAINTGGMTSGTATGSPLPTAYDRAMEASPTTSGTGTTGSGTRDTSFPDTGTSPTTPAAGIGTSSSIGDGYDLEDTDEMSGTGRGTGSNSSTL